MDPTYEGASREVSVGSARRRILVVFLLDLGDYLSREQYGHVPIGLFRRALAMASRPCLEDVRSGLLRMLHDARLEHDSARSSMIRDLLREAELRLSLFRDLGVGAPAD